MVNPLKVDRLTGHLREYINHLRNLGDLGQAAVLSDPYKVGATRYYLQVAIEACIDIGNHVIASDRLGAPTSHRETFQILNQVGILPNDFTRTLQQMASMRNRLVHLYSEIDDDIVFAAILNAPADCEKFVQLILDYMQTNDEAE